jgi:antitoxin component YwqK of YwqJK toxin-antitoxin module
MSTLTLLLAIGCGGTPPETGEPTDPQPEINPAATEEFSDAARALQCPEGTTIERGANAKGVEYWCDRDGVMHGSYLREYPSGELATKGAYDNNDADGAWIWWHENGQESSKGKYAKAKQTGSWTWWHENGERQKEGDFLVGRKQGQWTAWHESGLKAEEGLYHNDMKNGTWRYYNDDEENTVARTEVWQNGQMTNEKVFDKGKEKKGR